jgi:hypothetical protein
MDRQSYTLKVFKKDRRCRSGERMVGTYEYTNVTPRWMQEEVADLRHALYRPQDGYHLEFDETYKVVRNLMSGAEVVIARDTPRCCDPSSELYWSM